MGKLHEVLAAERTIVGASDKLVEETRAKFSKYEHYFVGFIKTLTMLEESEANRALQSASKQEKALPTTVYETLDYVLDYWAKAEDIVATKNFANRVAVANVEFDGKVFIEDVPVDELMGLEARLQGLRTLIQSVPTQDASKSWVRDMSAPQKGTYKSLHIDRTTKTEKIMSAVVLYEATKEHPAQVKEAAKDVVVGTFEQHNWTGAATAFQKAEMLARVDRLIVEVKKARTRANMVEVENVRIGGKIKELVMAPLKD